MPQSLQPTRSEGPSLTPGAQSMRKLAWFCWGVAALAAVVVLISAITGLGDAGPGGLIAALIFAALGWVAFRMSDAFRHHGIPEIPLLIYPIFTAAGVFAIVGGIVLAFDDPFGLLLIPFGAVFIGAGWLAKNVLATPKGMKSIPVEHASFVSTPADGGVRHSGEAVLIDVPEDATEEDIARARAAWFASAWARRADWASGVIPEIPATVGGMSPITTLILYAAIGTVGAALAVWLEPIFWWLTAFCVLGAGVSIHTGARGALHKRKFAAATLRLRASPVHPGGRLEGRIDTGLHRDQRPDQGIDVSVKCIRRWEERVGRGDRQSTVLRQEVLWEASPTCPIVPNPEQPERLSIEIDQPLPADMPPGKLSRSNEGVHWELDIHGGMAGLDYRARFRLPVLSPGTPRPAP